MKALSFSRISIVIALLLGLIAAWSAAMPSRISANSITGGGGECCGKTPCDWHAVACAALPNKTCTISAACCRGPDTGSGNCTALGVEHKQCININCAMRPDEVCIE